MFDSKYQKITTIILVPLIDQSIKNVDTLTYREFWFNCNDYENLKNVKMPLIERRVGLKLEISEYNQDMSVVKLRIFK